MNILEAREGSDVVMSTRVLDGLIESMAMILAIKWSRKSVKGLLQDRREWRL